MSMKSLVLAAAALGVFSTARGDELTPGATLRVKFRIDNHFVPAAPDTMFLLLDHPFIDAPLGSYTANLFDGAVLLGTHTSTLLGLTQGQMLLTQFAVWKSATSVFTFDAPTVIDFTPLIDGSIQGVVELTIATGAMEVDLDKVGLEFGIALNSNSAYGVDPLPFITSVALGSFESFCFGDGSPAFACPCGNSGLRERGCQNSASTGGAYLRASGSTSPDQVVLTSSRELPSALSIFLQGDAPIAGGVPFGDGVRCIGGHLARLYSKHASRGGVSAPASGDPSITAQSAALGDPIPSGATRYYQVYYRDPDLAFCAAPAGATWNVSSAVAITW
jgi:hypothetical protein